MYKKRKYKCTCSLQCLLGSRHKSDGNVLLFVCSFVCLSPTHSCRPLADWRSNALGLAPMTGRIVAVYLPHHRDVPHVYCSVKNFPREIYDKGGGLLIASFNTPHVLPLYTVSPKKQYTKNWRKLCQFLTEFQNSFTARKPTKFPTKLI